MGGHHHGVDALLRLVFGRLLSSDTVGLVGFSTGILRDANDATEWLVLRALDVEAAVENLTTAWVEPGLAPIELPAVLRRDSLLVPESLTSGVLISANELPTLEWADPPALVLVSLERLLRSPGKIRILAVTGSAHPLRGL
jgi:hypothetical protein